MKFVWFVLALSFLKTEFVSADVSQALLLAQSSMGMLEGRRAAKDEMPQSLHILGFTSDPSQPGSGLMKCSSVAYGRCIITAAHCFQGDSKNYEVRREGFDAKIDSTSIRLFAKTRKPFQGDDLAIARLESLPTSYITPDDLAKMEDMLFNNPTASLVSSSLHQIGIRGTVAGVGTDYEASAVSSAINRTSGEQAGAAHFGQILKGHQNVAHPHFQIGSVKIMGAVHEFVGKEMRAKLKESEDRMNNAYAIEKWWFQTRFEELRKEIEEAKKQISLLSSLVVLAYPTQLMPGDSGAPVFIDTPRGKVLAGVFNSIPIYQEQYFWSAKNAANDFLNEVHAGRGGFATPVVLRREWLVQKWKELKCAP